MATKDELRAAAAAKDSLSGEAARPSGRSAQGAEAVAKRALSRRRLEKLHSAFALLLAELAGMNVSDDQSRWARWYLEGYITWLSGTEEREAWLSEGDFPEE